jgi:hypothetical protein
MSSKSWRYLAVTYLVLYFVTIAIERHGLGRGPMSPIDKMLAAPIMWGFAVYGVQDGAAFGRFYRIARSENPFTFWSIISFQMLFGFFLLCWGLSGLSH